MPEEIDLEDLEEEPEEELEEEEEIEPEEEAAPKKPKPSRERDKSKRYELYKVENGEVERLRKTCPRCGPGIFLANHDERLACGKCGYTEFKKTTG